MCDPISAAALTLSAGGFVGKIIGGIQQNKAMKQEENQRANLEKLRAKRERVQQIRQARVQRAEILQAGANSGASESSSVQSGAAGVYAQAFSNISYINQQESIGQGIHNARQSQIDAQGTIMLGQGMQDIGGAIFANKQNIHDVFSQDPVPDDIFVTPKVSSPYDTGP